MKIQSIGIGVKIGDISVLNCPYDYYPYFQSFEETKCIVMILKQVGI
jgi:hypothetical protein